MYKNFYRKLKIKKQVFVMLFIIFSTLTILSLAILQFSFNIYDMRMYGQLSDILRLSVSNIEKELLKVENMSFNIMTDASIQKKIEVLKREKYSYEQSAALEELCQELFSQTRMEQYIDSIFILDSDGTKLAAVFSSKAIDHLGVWKKVKDIVKQNGEHTWALPSPDNPFLISCRKIRKVENGELEPLGVLVIQLDMDKLLRHSLNMSKNEEISMVILSEDNTVIYPIDSEDKYGFNNEDVLFEKKSGYVIRNNTNNKKYFITYQTSENSNWTYASFIPYEEIFKGIKSVRSGMFAIFMVGLIIIIIISAKFTDGITKPIELLSTQIRQLDGENFNVKELLVSSDDTENELEHLYHDFYSMVKKINSLINENYLKQIALKESELKMLQSQINPHFLYNTLESINWMAKKNKQNEIADMVKSLGRLLRSSISGKEHLITLEEEINLLKDYILIQKIRYEERLVIDINVDKEFYSCLIPKLSLQPIVENCINHALEKVPETCEVMVCAEKQDDTLAISIHDNGPGMTDQFLDKLSRGQIKPKGLGIGLRNVDERVKMAFGKSYGVKIDSRINIGTTVTIYLPINNKNESNLAG